MKHMCFDIDLNTESILKAKRSARVNGCVGPHAITPKVVASFCDSNTRVLNFGAGKPNKEGLYQHSELIRMTGAEVVEYDFDLPVPEGDFDIVFASNVLNVQSDVGMFLSTLQQIKFFCRDGTKVFCNYPNKPRYLDLDTKTVIKYLETTFGGQVETIQGTHVFFVLNKE